MNRPHRWIKRLWSGKRPPPRGALILAYHRVTQLASDPQWLSVTPQHFAEHLEVLVSGCQTLKLAELTDRGRPGGLPPRAVVVTFDDGYADNLHEAKPLLDKAGVPATVFVTTGKLNEPSEFWWDGLEDLLLQTLELPPALTLTLAGAQRTWSLENGGDRQQTGAGATSGWNVAMANDPTPRHRLYRELAPLLRDLDQTGRETALDYVARWAGATRRVRPSHRTLSAEEIRRLAADGLVEIGAHTVTHSVLSRQPPQAQQHELEQSKAVLEDILARPVLSCSYPFGTRADYTDETVRLAGRAGYRRACSNFEGIAHARTPPLELPRFLVRDWDGDGFARQLEGWFGYADSAG
jgi:peptidoglycan/xylan/chitin deacetylase (PgdA/CDA1 family)